jgi:protein tyrosine kinase modulator
MPPTATLTVDDVFGILRRRIWLLLVTLALVSTATAVGVLLLPNRYRSETLILVVPQRVPDSYVKSTVTARIEDRLLSITYQILSRTRLERIINDFNLYATKRRTGVMETIVEDMRKDITIKVVKGDAFRVAYVGDDPRTVMQVTERLASLFIEDNRSLAMRAGASSITRRSSRRTGIDLPESYPRS